VPDTLGIPFATGLNNQNEEPQIAQMGSQVTAEVICANLRNLRLFLVV
jgi:hypothetical protein